MNPATWSFKNSVTVTALAVLILAGGYVSYLDLGRLEDPEFTIKDAKISTRYPGASAREVEEEVTEVIEGAIQQLGQVKHLESVSMPGLSIITVTMKDKYDKAGLPQVWDELRRKVGDHQNQLPPGAGPSIVNDDFGDVYGIYFAIWGDGYTFAELKEHAKMLQRELVLCDGVAKVVFQGDNPETVYVEISREKMAQLGVSERAIYSALRGKNLVTPAGRVDVGREYIRIVPTGQFDTVEEIGNVVVEGFRGDRQVFLKDVASIRRDYQDPPSNILRVNGRRGIGLGISVVEGGNVVTMGESVSRRLRELEADTPIGIEQTFLYYQPDYIAKAVDNFVISLVEAIAIVIGVLLFAMGARSGFLIGGILLLTIFGTLILMDLNGVAMERISLGALIIALGMLVDNAIVVVEGIQIGMEQGKKGKDVAIDIVKRTMWPLFAATVIAILAFAAIGASQDKTGEYCRSLFSVIIYSLGLSWLLAVTVTPVAAVKFLKQKDGERAGEAVDPYAGKGYRIYRGLLSGCIRHRWATLLVMAILLVFSLQGFGFVKTSFFPDSTTPQFTVDYWTTEGAHIEETEADMADVERYVMGLEGVENVLTLVGAGALRFMLTYAPEDPNPAYGQFIVTVDKFERMAELVPTIEEYIHSHHPESMAYSKAYVMGPGGGSDVELRIRGPEPAVLRDLSQQVQKIMAADPEARDVRDDWREQVKVLRPVLAETAASNAGITRADVSRAIARNFSGSAVGIYRESDELIPIVARGPLAERDNVDAIKDMRLWSPVAQGYVPLRSVVADFEIVWEDNIIGRRDRRPTIVPQCNSTGDIASPMFKRLRPRIESEVRLPPGYEFQWGGEYEDSADATDALAGRLPGTLLMMVVIVIILFNSLKQPGIIWLTVPLAIIGVTWGLLLTGLPFGFMAILGVLSLIGMLIKNAIVLIDETDIQIREGKPPFQGIMDAAVSRLRPVSMAAGTTVLGMIPLLPDPFFAGMAVTIMAGLTFATVLTMIVVPTLYAVFFKVCWEAE